MLSLRCLLILLCFAPSLPVLESEELPLLSESAIANDVVTSAGVEGIDTMVVPSSSEGNLRFGLLDRTVVACSVVCLLEGTATKLRSTV